MGWESAEKVQKNDAGEFRAMIGGEWVPVAKAQKSDTGEYRVDRGAPAPTTAPVSARQIPGMEGATMAGDFKEKSRRLTKDDPNVVDRTIMGLIDAFPQAASAAERLLGQGSMGGRVIQGAADLPVGVMQLAANVAGKLPGLSDVADATNEKVSAINDRTEQLRGKNAGSFDFARLAGNIVGPGAIAARALAPVRGATMAEKMLIGQGGGAAFGVASPKNTDAKGYDEQAAEQGATGGAAGAAFPLVTAAGGKVFDAAKSITDLLTERGAKNILNKYQTRIIGEDNVPQVKKALENAEELVPGSKPTAAEALVGVPAGSPVVAHQRITSTTAGGPSAAFGQRILDQREARLAAIEARKAATAPMRESALSQANAGGVSGNSAVEGIDAMLSQPGLRASDVVGKTLGSIKEKILRFTNKNGTIDANDLYTIRKEIGNTIQTHAKESANWDKRLASGLERDIQRTIDDSIEKAGGAGWKGYLQKFSEMSKGIDADIQRSKDAVRPVQRTNLGGGVNVAQDQTAHIPNMLSRPMMIANAILSKLGAGVEGRVDAEASRRYLDPKYFASELDKVAPKDRNAVIEAILQIAPPQTAMQMVQPKGEQR